eukprot:GHVS01070472.1.p1 GENE.GHVS01070472.1~~GHVS01070472.1.p1  ORF type:complete len:329 (-),score=42.14 GHVS01070472.1:223-1209(-)
MGVRCLVGVLLLLHVLHFSCQEIRDTTEGNEAYGIPDAEELTYEESEEFPISAQSVSDVSLNDDEMLIEGASFKRRGSGSSLLSGGGLLSGKRQRARYPLYDVSEVMDKFEDEAPASYHVEESNHFFDRKREDHSSHDEIQVENYYDHSSHHAPQDEHYIEEREYTVPSRHRGVSATVNTQLSFETPFAGKRRSSNQALGLTSSRYSPAFFTDGRFTSSTRPSRMDFGEMCCADCPDRNISCLAACKRTGCQRVGTCRDAGKGAYASFCQKRCDVMMGMSFGAVRFLPDKACRGSCSGNVQKLCAAKSCTDYGCYAPECADIAPSKCL